MRPISSNPATLVASMNSNQLQISWPQEHTGWILQLQTNSIAAGLGTNWTTIANSDQTNQINILPNLTNQAVFFRLTHP